jgi:hypothetical protein
VSWLYSATRTKWRISSKHLFGSMPY